MSEENGIRKQVVSNHHYLVLYKAEKEYMKNRDKHGKDALNNLLKAALDFS